MAARKPDSEVGPLGVWAYDTRVLLELSDDQAARAAGVTKATIRKIEGGSTRKPSARLLHDLYRFYRQEGERLERPVEEPPGYRTPLVAPVPDPVAAAIREQTEVMREILAVLRTLAPTKATADRAAATAKQEGLRRAGIPEPAGPGPTVPMPGPSPRETGERP